MDFRVELDVFRGPLDLLLYLVRRHEVEITEIPIALVTEQYLGYLEILQQLDIDSVGDFLETASTLAEIKSRMLLPRADETEEPLDDPRRELVEQLLEYKRFRDAASLLEERSRAWQQRYPRLADDLAGQRPDLENQPLREVELWDLVAAFGRIMRQRALSQPSNIVYDDTPIHVYITRLRELLDRRGRIGLGELFRPDMHKSTMIGMFLAVLELVRHFGVRAEQNAAFGEIWLLESAPASAAASGELDLPSRPSASEGEPSDAAASPPAPPTKPR